MAVDVLGAALETPQERVVHPTDERHRAAEPATTPEPARSLVREEEPILHGVSTLPWRAVRALSCLALALAIVACTTLPERGPAPDRIRITGTVVDETTSRPLQGVCISGGKAGGCTWKTDEQGHFRIDGLIPAEWHFFFEAPEYQQQKVELILKPGETRDLDVRLTPNKERP